MAHPIRLFLAVFLFVIPFVLGAPIFLTGEDVDRMRAEGMSEASILSKISESLPNPDFLDSLFIPARDNSGDISPGSLPVPQMLPLATNHKSVSQRAHHVLSVLFGVKSRSLVVRGTAYEGHEGEIRRPATGRFWGKR